MMVQQTPRRARILMSIGGFQRDGRAARDPGQHDIYLTQRFIIAWRVWLTHHPHKTGLDGRGYYRDLFADETIDNPDQRIQQDVDIFTAGAGTPNAPSNGTASTLLFGAVQSIILVISFTAILWNLSGTLNIFGVSIPRAMF